MYLNGVRSILLDYALPDPFISPDSKRLSNRIIRGIKRLQKINTPQNPPKKALHVGLLKMLLPTFNLRLHDDRMLWAACCFAVFGLLRIGEFTTNKTTTQGVLLSKHVSRINNTIMLYLIKSKTDIFRQGVTIRLHANHTVVCPLAAYLLYTKLSMVKLSPSTAAFRRRNGLPLTRSYLVSQLKKKLNSIGIASEHFSGISFRKGGATTLSMLGVPDHVIQTLGRWKSGCYTRYIESSYTAVIRAQKQMANVPATSNM